MVGHILIDPNQVHSYRELDSDHELLEALDNYYSMQCFAAENQFVDISTNQSVTTKEIFSNATSWFRTYMLTDETCNGKWIGFIEFYNPELKSTICFYEDFVAFKTLTHFFEDANLYNNSKYDLIKRAIYIAMNIVLNKYESMPLDMDEFSLEILKKDFSEHFNNFNEIENLNTRRQFWLQMEAILENSKELKDYFTKELAKIYEKGQFKKEMYVQVYLDKKYMEPKVSSSEILANIQACEEEYLHVLGDDFTIINGKELEIKKPLSQDLRKVS